MKFNSNKFLLIILLVAFSGVESYAQCYKTVGSRGGSSAFSLEIGAGMPILISPTNDSKFGDNKKVELGLRYLPERSEEHTSELQSRGHLVCRLMLDKKK